MIVKKRNRSDMIIHTFTDEDGVTNYEWMFDNHRFMIWFDGDEPGWTFVSDCDDQIMECGDLPPELL